MMRLPAAQTPMITIITPNFNQGNYLEETIHSVLIQDYPNLEYIVMDGGSTDNSLEVIRKFDQAITAWESSKDRGQYDALQKGFSRSHGEIMAYLNSDDLYFPWTLRVVGEIFATFPEVEWLTTSSISATPSDGRFPIVSVRFNRSRRRFMETRDKLLKKRNFIQQESTFWRRRLWEKAGGRLNTELKYAGDFDLWARFYEHASPVTLNIPLAMFRYRQDQKTSTLDEYILEAESVLSRYSRPLWTPAVLIRLLNLVYLRARTNSNWLGARCDRIEYDFRANYWVYRKYLEWRD